MLHGLVFGDGTLEQQEVRSGEHVHYVAALRRASREVQRFFDQVNFSPCLDVHPGYAGPASCARRRQPEARASRDADPEYIAGFVDGWLAADGDPVKAGSWRLRSIDHEALAWLERRPLAGFVDDRLGRGGGIGDELRRAQPADRWLYLATRETYWRVMSVEPPEAEHETRSARSCPEKHTFTLAGGIYTGNCGACEPECPVEAIFPEDALPESGSRS